MEDVKNIIESLLLVAEGPLTVERIKNVLALVETKEIRKVLAALTEEYNSRKGGFYLGEVAGGYQIRTRPEYTEYIKRLLQPAPFRMSKAALETLAVIAYKQPIIRSDVEQIRGVDCGGILRMLLERKLIKVLGRKEIPGRPIIYATTKHFLELFDLKNIRDLPTLKEIRELGDTSAETADTEPGDTPPEVSPRMPAEGGNDEIVDPPSAAEGESTSVMPEETTTDDADEPITDETQKDD